MCIRVSVCMRNGVEGRMQIARNRLLQFHHNPTSNLAPRSL